MSKVPTCKLRIEGMPELDFAMLIEFDQAWQQLTDFGQVTLPRNIKTLSGVDVAKLIERGNRIEIELGYDGNDEIEFIGYVTDVTAGYPLVINFEDSMYLMKQKTVNISGKSINLKDLIAAIIPEGISYEVVDAELGAYRFPKNTAAQILQYLQKTYGIYSWFRNEVLYVGFAYAFNSDQTASSGFRTIKYDFEKNIKEDNNHLQYRFADKVNYKVNVISILPDNTKIETTVGDNDGETRTLHFYNIRTEAEVKRLANEELKKMKVDGWRGKFRTFGYPRAKHGDVATITDPDFPEYERGSHFLDKVKTYWGINGYYRDLTPGRSAS